jgi:glycolate oxidase
MAAPNALVRELRELLGDERVVEAENDRLTYAYDASFISHLITHPPDAVVVARDEEDVVKTLRFAQERGVPIVPRGAASGQAGGTIPTHGGIVLALNRMNRVLAVDPTNLQVLTEPGVIHWRLLQALAPHGLFFPPDPGSSKMCTVGGMAATNAHGMRAVKYGPTADWVLGLNVVLPGGRVITTGTAHSRARQTSSGLELSKLFVGSEGSLGIITRLRLKLLPIPRAKAAVLALFDKLEHAGRAVSAVFGAGIMPSACEILDRGAIQAVNLYKPETGLPECEAMLLFEVDGNPPGVEFDAQRIVEAVSELALRAEWSADPKRIARLWEGRSVVGAAAALVRPGAFRAFCGEDLCVPLDRMPEALREVREIGARHGIPVVTYGHIGGGGLHPGLLIDAHSAAEIAAVQRVADDIHRLALRLGGTTTGEHGVGITRAPYMAREHGPALDVMREIKQALDPRGIMNPGKVIPLPDAPGVPPIIQVQADADGETPLGATASPAYEDLG